MIDALIGTEILKKLQREGEAKVVDITPKAE
jgi:hypothetical protein